MTHLLPHWRRLVIKTGKLLIRWAMDAELRRELSRIYDRLDGEMPVLLQKTGPLQVSGSIASAIADVTGHQATSDRMDAVIALYNPVAAALRNRRP